MLNLLALVVLLTVMYYLIGIETPAQYRVRALLWFTAGLAVVVLAIVLIQ